MYYLKHFKFYLLKILQSAGLLAKINFSVSKKIGGKKILIPIHGAVGLNNLLDNHEIAVRQLFDELLPQDCVVFDIGTNIGQTILNLLSLKRSVIYYGFEPNPLCYQYTRHFIDINQLTNFRLYPVGLSNSNAIVKLYADKPHATGASIIENFRRHKKFQNYVSQVPVMRGDDIVAKERLIKIDLLKIDVEGAELEVIQGLRQTVEQYLPLIILEILPVYSIDNPSGNQRKRRQDALLAELNDRYSLYRVEEETQKLKFITAIEVHSDMSKTNYLFIPKEKIATYRYLLS